MGGNAEHWVVQSSTPHLIYAVLSLCSHQLRDIMRRKLWWNNESLQISLAYNGRKEARSKLWKNMNNPVCIAKHLVDTKK